MTYSENASLLSEKGLDFFTFIIYSAYSMA
jgi:hypothetical protein